MQRSRQIFAHGFTGKSVAVFALGYWPAFAIIGKLCIGTVSMTVPGTEVAMTLPSIDLTVNTPSFSTAFTIPTVSFAVTKPSATIEMESC